MSSIKVSLMIIAAILIVILLVFAYKQRDDTSQVKSDKQYIIRYLPLGDSYTIGQSVDPAKNWPNQLVDRLQNDTVSIGILDNPAVTGYTTQDLIDKELPLVQKLKPNLVTIQIGVNDYVQGVPEATFRKNFDYIINYVRQNMAEPKRIVLVTIPDYAKTPTGAQYGDPAAATKAIERSNEAIQQAGATYGLPVADVFPISQKVSEDPTLTADDGLHPSAKQYTDWIDVIYPKVKQLL